MEFLFIMTMPTPNSDIVISYDLFTSCFLVCMVSNIFRDWFRLSNIRPYSILFNKIVIKLRPLHARPYVIPQFLNCKKT